MVQILYLVGYRYEERRPPKNRSPNLVENGSVMMFDEWHPSSNSEHTTVVSSHDRFDGLLSLIRFQESNLLHANYDLFSTDGWCVDMDSYVYQNFTIDSGVEYTNENQFE